MTRDATTIWQTDPSETERTEYLKLLEELREIEAKFEGEFAVFGCCEMAAGLPWIPWLFSGARRGEQLYCQSIPLMCANLSNIQSTDEIDRAFSFMGRICSPSYFTRGLWAQSAARAGSALYAVRRGGGSWEAGDRDCGLLLATVDRSFLYRPAIDPDRVDNWRAADVRTQWDAGNLTLIASVPDVEWFDPSELQ